MAIGIGMLILAYLLIWAGWKNQSLTGQIKQAFVPSGRKR